MIYVETIYSHFNLYNHLKELSLKNINNSISDCCSNLKICHGEDWLSHIRDNLTILKTRNEKSEKNVNVKNNENNLEKHTSFILFIYLYLFSYKSSIKDKNSCKLILNYCKLCNFDISTNYLPSFISLFTFINPLEYIHPEYYECLSYYLPIDMLDSKGYSLLNYAVIHRDNEKIKSIKSLLTDLDHEESVYSNVASLAYQILHKGKKEDKQCLFLLDPKCNISYYRKLFDLFDLCCIDEPYRNTEILRFLYSSTSSTSPTSLNTNRKKQKLCISSYLNLKLLSNRSILSVLNDIELIKVCVQFGLQIKTIDFIKSCIFLSDNCIHDILSNPECFVDLDYRVYNDLDSFNYYNRFLSIKNKMETIKYKFDICKQARKDFEKNILSTFEIHTPLPTVLNQLIISYF